MSDPLVVEAWSQVAPGYRDYWGPRFRPFLDEALAALAPGPGPLAVVGCGPGDEVLALAERFPARAIHASDPAAPMLDLLRARLAGQGLTRIEPRQGDACQLPEQVQGLGGVFSSWVLQLLPDRSAALAAWARALGSGGRIVAVFWPRQPADSAWGRMGRAIERVSGKARPSWEPGLRAALPGLGLELVRDEALVHPIAHASPAEAWRELCASCSLQVLLRRLGPDQARACGQAWLEDSGLEARDGRWVHRATARLWVLAPSG